MNKKLSKIAALLLALVLVVSLAACGSKDPVSTSTPAPVTQAPAAPTPAPAPVPDPEVVDDTPALAPDVAEFLRDWGADPVLTRPAKATQNTAENTPLVISTINFNGQFSPFFSSSAYDAEVSDWTHLSLMTTDRLGAIIFDAIQGETTRFNGVDYFYQGPANLYQSYDPVTDITTYRVRIRQDIFFSDGVQATADDIIFTYYVYLDPAYDGSNMLSSESIVGYQSYLTQIPEAALEKYLPIFDEILAAGSGHTWSSSDSWTEDVHNTFWAKIKDAWLASVQEIADFCETHYYGYILGEAPGFPYTAEDGLANANLKIAAGMLLWGFLSEQADGTFVNKDTGRTWTLQGSDVPTAQDFYDATYASFDGDPNAYWNNEDPNGVGNLSGSVVNDMMKDLASAEGAGGAVTHISGIKKLDKFSVEIQLHGFSAPAIYRLFGVNIAPMHYYGNPAQYDYDNNKFGFPRGDLTIVKSKTSHPMGAGPFKFIEFSNKVVYFESNPTYYKGEPYIKYMQYKETDTGSQGEELTGILAGTHDLANLSGSQENLRQLKEANSNGEITGDKVYTTMVDNLGYGYVGVNAAAINVNADPGSAASKNLRKGLATIFAVFREIACNSYYAELGYVVNYSISSTSWAAPQPLDQGYEVAYSKDVNGKQIYTAGMSHDDRVAAAKEAALGFFAAAGYTVENGKITAGPAGVRKNVITEAELDYMYFEILLGSSGSSDHPAFSLLTDATAVFNDLGLNVEFHSIDFSNMLEVVKAGGADVFAMAWGSTIDPDMYQLWHSSQICGAPGSSASNHSYFVNPAADDLLLAARMSDNQSYRKTVYKQIMDMILDWAVEVPNYQRKNFIILSSERINTDTVTPGVSTYWGPTSEIQYLQFR